MYTNPSVDDLCETCKALCFAAWELLRGLRPRPDPADHQDFMFLEQWAENATATIASVSAPTSCRLCLLTFFTRSKHDQTRESPRVRPRLPKPGDKVRYAMYKAWGEGRTGTIRFVSPDSTQSWLFCREVQTSEGHRCSKLFELIVELTFWTENGADFFLHYRPESKLPVLPSQQTRMARRKPLRRSRTNIKDAQAKLNDESYVSSETWSAQAIGQAKLWLGICRSQHGSCRSSAFELPLRLIDVQAEQGSRRDGFPIDERYGGPIKLCYTESFPPDTEYLTLSHRWGDGPPVVLTHETKAQYHKSIPTGLLDKPAGKVFRDAIHITRCLGFQYLWIDSICINQQDDHEKGTEIMKMHQIYSGAVLNLSATSAMSGAEGMITTRNAASVAPIVLEMDSTPPDGESGKMILFRDNWLTEVDKGPVNQRAWVFQERMLATRVLHFTWSQIYWECNSCTASEVHPRHDPEVYSPSVAMRGPRKRNLRMCTSSPADFPGLWAELLQRYSKTDISFSTDRLVAISAIARAICESAGLRASDYYAGIWAPFLPRAMLWTFQSPGRRPPTYVAPTWSWASVEGQSLARTIHDDVDADAISVVVIATTLKSGDQFGQVTAGAARLRGSVYKVLLRRFDIAGEQASISGSSDMHEYLVYTHNGRRSIVDSQAPYLQIYWDVRTEMDIQTSGTTYYYMPFHHGSSEMELADHEHGDLCSPFCWTSGLILRRVEDRNGSYNRVGFAIHNGALDVGDDDDNALSFWDHYQLLDCVSMPLSGSDYVEVHPTGKVTIEIL